MLTQEHPSPASVISLDGETNPGACIHLRLGSASGALDAEKAARGRPLPRAVDILRRTKVGELEVTGTRTYISTKPPRAEAGVENAWGAASSGHAHGGNTCCSNNSRLIFATI